MKSKYAAVIARNGANRKLIRDEQRQALGRKLGALSKGKRKPTQAEKDEIAAYLARNPIPYGEST